MDKTIRNILIILSFLFIMVFIIRPVTCGDVWFHLRTGQWILENKAVPLQDMYSYTAEGNEWIDSHWLFQAVLYLVYKIIGMNGLPLLRFLVFTGAFILLFKTGYDRRKFMVSLLLLVVVVYMTNERVLVRPEMFTFLFIALYGYILDRYRHSDDKLVWVLPAIQLVWANMHGLHIIGIVMVFSWLAGELVSWKLKLPFDWSGKGIIKDKKYFHLLGVGFAMVAVSFLQPHGLKGTLYPFLIFTEIGKGASEWMQMVAELKPSLYSVGDKFAVVLYRYMIIGSLASIVLNIKKLRLSSIIIYTGLLYVSLLARRNMPLFGYVAMPLVVHNIVGSWDGIAAAVKKRVKLPRLAVLKYILGFIMAVFMLVNIKGLVSGDYYARRRSLQRFSLGVSDIEYPAGAIDFIKANGIKGNVFNDGAIGGYFIWNCWPDRKVFIDGRWEVYGDDFLLDYWSLVNRSSSWGSIARQHGIDYVLFRHTSSEATRFIPELHASPGWALVYLDGIASVFVKRTPANLEMIKRTELDFTKYAGIADGAIAGAGAQARFRRAYLHQNLAKKFLEVLGQDILAEYEYRNALGICPEFFEVYNNLGVLYQKRQMWDKAARAFERALEIEPNYAEAHCNYGNMFFRRGDFEKAIARYKLAIKKNPGYASAYFNLAAAYNRRNDLENAEKSYKAAIRKNPDYHEAYNNLATVYGKAGKPELQEAMFRKAMEINPYYFDAHFNLAMLYSGKDWPAMIKELNIAAGINPGYRELHYNLGIAYQNTGQKVQAIKEYLREIEYNPGHASSYKNVGIVYFGNGMQAEAAHYWAKYLELNPGAPDAAVMRQEIDKIKR